jgi:CBS domain containing-hemolysin-like protein
VNPWIQLFIAFVLVLLTAFFVAAELALVKIRSTRLDELAARKIFGAAKARDAVRNVHSYLHATKFGVMVCALVLGKVGDEAVHHLLTPAFLLLPKILISWLPSLIVMVCVAFVEFVLGELIPTTLAIKDAEKILLATIYPLDIFYKICRWPLSAMGKLSNGILAIFGIKTTHEEEDAHSEAEIRLIVEQSGEDGRLKQSDAELVQRIFDFTHSQAKHVMVPRPDLVLLSTNKPLKENILIAESSGYTRFPLCKGDSADDILGMIHIRDLLRFDTEDLTPLARDVPRVPETKPIDQLLRELQRERHHMAIVIDEYGGTAGIVTIEDIIEEIIGDIQDEHDPTVPELIPDGTRAYLVDARMSLDKLIRTLEFVGPEEENDIETVGGWLLVKSGGKIRIGASAQFGEALLTIVEVTGRRVRKARLILPGLVLEDSSDALSPDDH